MPPRGVAPRPLAAVRPPGGLRRRLERAPTVEKPLPREGDEGGEKSEGRGLRGLCAARGVGCAGRLLTHATKNLDPPRPGALRVDKKRPAPGRSRPSSSRRTAHLQIAAPVNTLSRPESGFLPRHGDAHPRFEGAGGWRRAARVHAPEAETPPVSAPRFKGAGAAHPRAELDEQVEGCASNHARLGHDGRAAIPAEAGKAQRKSQIANPPADAKLSRGAGSKAREYISMSGICSRGKKNSA